MGSTNKTQYLQLPQWIGTDQPTWLGDMNDAFLKIDSGYNTISGNASSAISQAGQAVQTATKASEQASEALTAAGEASSDAETATSTANNALTTANQANTAISGITQKVQTLETNFATIDDWVGGNMTAGAAITTSVFGAAYYNMALKLVNIIARVSAFADSIPAGTVLYTLPSSFTNIVTSNRTLYGILQCRMSNGTFDAFDLGLKNNGGSIQLYAVRGVTSSPGMSSGSINVMLNASQW